MFFRLDAEKAVQAAGVLLRAHEGRQMEHLRLLKLLYIADRESLRLTGRPIVGSRPVAMKHGPLHIEVYELIRGAHPAEQVWSAHITKSGTTIRLAGDPGVLKLSKQDIEILNTVAERYINDSEWDIVELTHQFSEWAKNYVAGAAASNPAEIPIEDILEGVGFSAVDRAHILSEMKEVQEVDALFPSSAPLVPR
jgi:uncharacterized phage-associated protein